MQLTKEELEKIHRMVKSYRDKYDEIKNLEETIGKLIKTRDKIKEQLEVIRLEEDGFGKSLIEKYGKGKFNIHTFEYELENEQK